MGIWGTYYLVMIFCFKSQTLHWIPEVWDQQDGYPSALRKEPMPATMRNRPGPVST